MARRKEPIIPDSILDQLLAGSDAKTAFESNGLLDQLKKALAERALNAEMDHHLSGEPVICGPCCATTVVGTALRRRAWFIGPDGTANMPQRSSMGSTAQSRWMPTAVTLTSPRRTGWVAIP